MPDENESINKFLNAAKEWYESQRSQSGVVNTNVMNAGLVVSRMAAEGLPIGDERLYSSKKSQVKGLSGASIAKILATHGEFRTFTREGGRTSRGTVHLAASFRDVLNRVRLADDEHLDSNKLSHSLEAFFTNCVRTDYFDKQRISVAIDPSKPVPAIISDILSAVAERSDKPTGIVLQHLVGAKLQLRFPQVDIGVDQANAADWQTDREGDYQIGTTAFHVTVAPMERLVTRCIENKNAGYRPVILTLENKVMAARQMADNAGMVDHISVQSAEIFIGNNIEEIAIYDGEKIREGVARLVSAYNHRIDSIEVDKSLMIEEPKWIVEIMSKSDVFVSGLDTDK